MTKKDYILIANILKKYKTPMDEQSNKNESELELYEAIENDFINMLAKDNPRFNRDTFINYINRT